MILERASVSSPRAILVRTSLVSSDISARRSGVSVFGWSDATSNWGSTVGSTISVTTLGSSAGISPAMILVCGKNNFTRR